MPAVLRPVLLTEGMGDQIAVPYLLRKIVESLGANEIVPAARPIKAGDINKLIRPGQLERFIVYGSSREDGDSVLLILDCDDSCPREVAREFLRRISAIQPPITKPVGIAFLKKEFECLFFASLPSIAERYPEFGWKLDKLDITQNMEDIRGAKGQLSRLMRTGRAYKETRDQVRFVSALDFDLLRVQSRSFRHCESVVEWMAGRRHGTAQLYPVV